MHVTNKTLEYWARRAEEVEIEGRMFVDGEFSPALLDATFDVLNPATGKVIGQVAKGGEADVDRAVKAAREAYRSGVWAKLPPRARAAVLLRFANLIEEYTDDFAVLDVLDMGKPITEMLQIDVPGAMLTFRFVAEAIDKLEGAVTSTTTEALHYMVHQPFGVVGCIVPWNYPLMMAAWKVAPALAAGNSVVLKAAEQSPHSAALLARLFVQAGGPPGVFNTINGLGEEAGRALAQHLDVDRIAFTGSTEVGRLMMQYAGKSNMKSVSVECGGKSPHVIFDDVIDVRAAAHSAALAIFGNQGEVCTAGSRIIVQAGVYDEFIKHLAEEAHRFVAGNPLDPATTMGSLVSREHQERVLNYVAGARKQQAKLIHEGNLSRALADGAFVAPVIFGDVQSTMTIAQEEIFGPVAAVMKFEHYEEAIELANDSRYGLGAGVWTSNVDTAHRFARDVESGMVWINGYMNGDMTQPWGGWKQSGNGRDKGLHSLLENMRLKSVWLTLSQD